MLLINVVVIFRIVRTLKKQDSVDFICNSVIHDHVGINDNIDSNQINSNDRHNNNDNILIIVIIT